MLVFGKSFELRGMIARPVEAQGGQRVDMGIDLADPRFQCIEQLASAQIACLQAPSATSQAVISIRELSAAIGHLQYAVLAVCLALKYQRGTRAFRFDNAVKGHAI